KVLRKLNKVLREGVKGRRWLSRGTAGRSRLVLGSRGTFECRPQAAGLQLKVEEQALTAVLQIEAGQLLDALQAVQEGVGVDVEGGGRLGRAAAAVQVGR